MKKLILLCLLVCMICLPFSASAAEAAAVELGKYGIMQGDPDGNLRLSASITRAEFSKMIIAAKEARTHAPTATLFPDVPSSHWASGFIARAASLGILSGFEDGTFLPDAFITHEQAVKIVVSALGYGGEAESLGSYPDGYMQVAKNLGILGTLSADGLPATRGEIATLLLSAFDIPHKVEKKLYYFDKRGALTYKDASVFLDGQNGNPLTTFRTIQH